jgi:hypothetical protein
MEKCCKCKVEKDAEEFSICQSKKDGLHSKCKACCQKYYQNPEIKERQRKAMREVNLKRKYGVTLKDVRTLVEIQRGECPICGDTVTEANGVDHCHKTAAVRGVLCNTCNAGLGLLHDDPSFCRRAVLYLEMQQLDLALAA